MTIKLYNTAKREVETFVPRDPKNVGMYVCGPTVYDTAHIGNARPAVIFDVLARLLRQEYGDDHVTYVRNITDVEDKIIDGAAKRGISIEELTKETTAQYHADMAALGVELPNREPKATEHIQGMIEMIETLIAKGHAYEAEGHVLFSVPSMPDYGKLSGRNRDEMIEGARVEVAPFKKDPADFVLWKPSPGDMHGWESPWGKGRPGWHIECSVMSKAELGEAFDIHGGGRDLIFPHHENEVAQSCCANDDKTFARYWVHNGFLTVDGKKMSKSLGNFFTVRDLLEKTTRLEGCAGEIYRFVLLNTDYRKPLNWTEDGVTNAENSLDTIYTALKALEGVEADETQVAEGVIHHLENDLDTPFALKELIAIAKEANKAGDATEKARLKGQLLAGAKLLGLAQQSLDDWFKGVRDTGEAENGLTDEGIDALIEERDAAKKNKNYARADEIRDELKAAGIILEDSPEGTTWKRA
ncbi:cysteine--tRNA ligase [Sneathiella sp. P13V-1]|uniref:cysteine--tRNA ligase n=1 Tax=Sneathiella sp. P13V-1 TaxID=2697366 RepID=UPI00187B8B84|nr:cysteine--tRNA ligase [Sneathiella sp. P13V-1]MBE7637135.1 cysteine--tRNA ligase [Sneathiella sp. P13V-1]